MNKDMQEKPILVCLEDLYQGIPDESVNLTFRHLAEVNNTSEKKKPSTTTLTPSRSLTKLPSLDFTKGLQGFSHHHDQHHHVQNFGHGESSPRGHPGHFNHHAGGGSQRSPRCMASGDDHSKYASFDGMSVASGRGSRRPRPGIPHSKICATCNTYTYIFRTRCLVRA